MRRMRAAGQDRMAQRAEGSVERGQAAMQALLALAGPVVRHSADRAAWPVRAASPVKVATVDRRAKVDRQVKAAQAALQVRAKLAKVAQPARAARAAPPAS
jgi:hypothetical protein